MADFKKPHLNAFFDGLFEEGKTLNKTEGSHKACVVVGRALAEVGITEILVSAINGAWEESVLFFTSSGEWYVISFGSSVMEGIHGPYPDLTNAHIATRSVLQTTSL